MARHLSCLWHSRMSRGQDRGGYCRATVDSVDFTTTYFTVVLPRLSLHLRQYLADQTERESRENGESLIENFQILRSIYLPDNMYADFGKWARDLWLLIFDL